MRAFKTLYKINDFQFLFSFILKKKNCLFSLFYIFSTETNKTGSQKKKKRKSRYILAVTLYLLLNKQKESHSKLNATELSSVQHKLNRKFEKIANVISYLNCYRIFIMFTAFCLLFSFSKKNDSFRHHIISKMSSLTLCFD